MPHLSISSNGEKTNVSLEGNGGEISLLLLILTTEVYKKIDEFVDENTL